MSLSLRVVKFIAPLSPLVHYPRFFNSNYKSPNNHNSNSHGTIKEYELYCNLAKALFNDHSKPEYHSLKQDFLISTELTVKEHESEKKVNLIRDWNDINETVRDFGGPEFADHMSGHIFMQGTPIEDKSSKCIRIGDQFQLLSEDEITICVRCLKHWRNSINESRILIEMITKLDSEVCNRYRALEKGRKNEIAFSLCLLSSSVMENVRFPLMRQTEMEAKVVDATLEEIVLYLLLSCFVVRQNEKKKIELKAIETRILENFPNFSQTELSVCYSGLKVLSEKDCQRLKNTIEKELGFRM